MEIKSTKPSSISNAKEILLKRKDDGELGYEQSQALESTQRFANLDVDKADGLVQKLVKNYKMNEELAVKIVDIKPTTPATLRAILVRYRMEMSDEDVDRVLKELA